MRRRFVTGGLLLLIAAILGGCGSEGWTADGVKSASGLEKQEEQETLEEQGDITLQETLSMQTEQNGDGWYTVDSYISDVIADPVFGDYGRLIFPVDTWYYSGNTLGELRLTWYNNIDPDETVEIVNYMKDHA